MTKTSTHIQKLIIDHVCVLKKADFNDKLSPNDKLLKFRKTKSVDLTEKNILLKLLRNNGVR